MPTLSAPRFLTLLIAFSLTGTVAGAEPNAANDDHPARALVRLITGQLLAHTDGQMDRSSPEQVRTEVARLVVPHFDLDIVSRRVLGVHWDGANDEQRGRFRMLLQRYLADAYAGFVFDYRGQRVSYLPTRASASGTRAKVRTSVIKAGRPNVRVDYAVRKLGDAWKVYDVIANGVSLLTLYKAQFAYEIRRSGFNSLLTQLDARLPLAPAHAMREPAS